MSTTITFVDGEAGTVLMEVMEKRIQVERAPESVINAALQLTQHVMDTAKVKSAPQFSCKADYLHYLTELERKIQKSMKDQLP